MADERLRETLLRRAESVEPSPGGWAEIGRRIERQQKRTHTIRVSLVAGMSLAAIVLAFAVVRVAGPDTRDQSVAATGGGAASRVSTTLVESMAATPADDGSSATPSPGEVPVPGRVPDPDRPSVAAAPPPDPGTARNYTPEAVWPDTLAELENQQAAADAGQESWRNDPRAVAAAYVADRGVSGGSPTMAERPLPGGGDPAFRYVLSMTDSVRVHLAQLTDGSIYYVSGSRTDVIPVLHVARQGDQLSVELTSAAPGEVVVRTRQPGAGWGAGTTRRVVADQAVTLTVDGPASMALIVQVQHQSDDGYSTVSEQYVGAAALGVHYEDLHAGSILRFGGIGNIALDTTLENAERAAGFNMITNVSEHCTTLGSMGRPAGVSLMALNGSGRVDVAIVADRGVRTAAGIGSGSTLAEVRETYPDSEERLTDGRGRVVLRPAGSDPEGYEIVLGISEDTVTFMWSGREGLSMSDELCA